MLQAVVEAIPAAVDGSCVRVAVDGPDGAGKTIFADELATAIRDSGRPAIRVSLDDFHNVRAVRYRRGQHSPDGCWLDSYNYDRFIAYVLDPLGPGRLLGLLDIPERPVRDHGSTHGSPGWHRS